MKTLSLTSPYTRGPAVVQAQAALKRGNIFKADYLRGSQDGVLGEGTARAFIRAKFWLGYSEGSLKPVYGDQLHAYLTGVKKLGPLMRIRRARRLKAGARTPLRVKALNQARRYLGQKESPPGSNRIGFASLWYGIIGPWCAMGVTRWYVDAGSKAFARGSRYAYCPYMVADARAGRNGLQVVSYAEVLPGDIAMFNWDGDWDADHTGLLEEKLGGFTFQSIEANTAVGNDSNGGEVMRRERNVGQVQVFIRAGL